MVSVATRFGINAQELTAFMNNPKNKEAIIKKADAYKGEGISSKSSNICLPQSTNILLAYLGFSKVKNSK